MNRNIVLMSSKSKHSHILQKARDRVAFYLFALWIFSNQKRILHLRKIFKTCALQNINIKITINDGCENETTRKMSNKIFIYFFRCHKNENQLINLMTTCMPYSRWMNVARRQQAFFHFYRGNIFFPWIKNQWSMRFNKFPFGSYALGFLFYLFSSVFCSLFFCWLKKNRKNGRQKVFLSFGSSFLSVDIHRPQNKNYHLTFRNEKNLPYKNEFVN